MTGLAVAAWLLLVVAVVLYVRSRRRRRLVIPLASSPVDFYSPYRIPGRRRAGRGF